MANPEYLRGTERQVYQFFLDFLPHRPGLAVLQPLGTASLADAALLFDYSAIHNGRRRVCIPAKKTSSRGILWKSGYGFCSAF